MTRLKSKWFAAHKKNSVLLHIQTCRPTPLVLALVAHAIFLFAVFNMNEISTSGAKQDNSGPEKIFRIQMIGKTSSKPDTPGKEAAPSNIRAANPYTSAFAEPMHFDSSFFDVLYYAGPHYFKSSDLETKPAVVLDTLHNISFSAPNEPSQTATVRLLINEYGDVDRVIIDASTFSGYSQRQLIKTLSYMKFTPGLINETAVKSELIIEIKEEKAPRLTFPLEPNLIIN